MPLCTILIFKKLASTTCFCCSQSRQSVNHLVLASCECHLPARNTRTGVYSSSDQHLTLAESKQQSEGTSHTYHNHFNLDLWTFRAEQLLLLSVCEAIKSAYSMSAQQLKGDVDLSTGSIQFLSDILSWNYQCLFKQQLVNITISGKLQQQ